MRAIFISYRRDDSEGQAGRLLKDLASHFGQDAVFMDVAGIAPGRDFRRVIDEHVATCGVLLAVIGKAWIAAQDASGRRRLDDPADFVRLETASALKRDIPVIPVLVHGASMPQADQLPADLADLAYRNGVELTHARWDSDVQLLIKALEPYVQSAGVGPAAQAGAAVTGAAPQAPASGPVATTAHRRKSPSIAIAAGAVALVAVAIGAYKWSATPAPAMVPVPPPVATLDPGRKEVAKELQAPANAAPDAAAVAAAASAVAADRLAQAEREREALVAKKEADQQEADRRVAIDAAEKKLASDKAAAARRAQAERERDALVAKQQADQKEAERRAAISAEEKKRASDNAAAIKAADDKAVAERQAQAEREREAAQQAASKVAAWQRARWSVYNFPAPNGGALLFTIMPDGNPACASYDARTCLWQVRFQQLDFARIRPLVCGEMHHAVWGVAGYEDPKHWCSLARKIGTAGAPAR